MLPGLGSLGSGVFNSLGRVEMSSWACAAITGEKRAIMKSCREVWKKCIYIYIYIYTYICIYIYWKIIKSDQLDSL